jgi:uncharacterized membrane protein
VDRKGQLVKRSAIVPATFAVVAVAVPWLVTRVPEIGFALQRGFALVCHQQPERSFILFGGSVAVCARCLGIYFGAATGLLMRVSRRVAMQFFIAAVAANAVDWMAEIVGLHGNWMLVRFVLGIALGTAAAMLVVGSLERPTQAKEA